MNHIATTPLSTQRQNAMIHLAIVYVHFWVLEGAIRKWIPSVDSTFYFLRDGVLIAGIAIIFLRFGPPRTRKTSSLILWGLVLAWTFLLIGQILGLNILPQVALAGARNYIAPVLLPILLWRDGYGNVIPRVLKLIALYAPLQAILTLVQVGSPRTAWINVQTGGDEAFFTTSLGIVRASGTFSAPAGLILFATLCLISGLVIASGQTSVRRGYGWVAIISAVAIIAIGGSRGAVFAAFFVIAAWILYTAFSLRARQFLGMLAILALGSAAAWVVISAVPAVFDAFVQRFLDASQDEDTLARLGRAVFGFSDQVFFFWGQGSGVRSTIGIALGSGATWIEVDSTRWVAELGVVGFLLAWLRILFAVALMCSIVFQARRLPLSGTLSAAALVQILLFGSITTQPSTQGYFAILAVMYFASRNEMRVAVPTPQLQPRLVLR